MILSLSVSFSDFNIHVIPSSILLAFTLKIHRSPNSLGCYNSYQALNYDVFLIYMFRASRIIFVKTKFSNKKKNTRKKRDDRGCIEGE